MGTTKTITHLGLCAGYGGIELGLKRVLPALRTVALCEIEAFAIANLVAKMETGLMDPAPVWTDLKTFPWESFRDRVDILSGGYPCQPFSSAGKRLGTEDPRHLWPYIASGIQLLRPRVCFFENVEGHVSLGLREVIGDLEQMGYEVSWGIFSAAECGAPHQRKRVFIMAHRIGQGSQGWLRGWQDSGRESEHGYTGCSSAGAQDWWPSRPGQPQHAWEPPRVVGNAQGGTRLGRSSEDERHAAQSDESLGNAADAGCEGSRGQDDKGWQMQRPAEPDGSGSDWEMEPRQRQTESALGGDFDGATSGLDYAKLCVTCDNRTDELRLLGNGVVPATAELAFRTLLAK